MANFDVSSELLANTSLLYNIDYYISNFVKELQVASVVSGTFIKCFTENTNENRFRNGYP